MPTDPARRLFSLSIGVFFIGGFLSSLVNLFVPRLTLFYGLDYAQALGERLERLDLGSRHHRPSMAVPACRWQSSGTKQA